MVNPKDSVEKKEVLRKIESLAGRMFKKNEIRQREALSRPNYKNALALFQNDKNENYDSEKIIEIRAAEVKKHLSYL